MISGFSFFYCISVFKCKTVGFFFEIAAGLGEHALLV